jgi:hypothetical protein
MTRLFSERLRREFRVLVLRKIDLRKLAILKVA